MSKPCPGEAWVSAQRHHYIEADVRMVKMWVRGAETRQIITIKRKNAIEDPPEYGQETQ